jgi:hypothetical protein
MMIGSVLSTGGLAALAAKVVGKKGRAKQSFRKENLKEEPWAK